MEIKAYAKINLTLEVLGRRPDGFHEVRTVLQTIALADHLHFTPSPRLELECSSRELCGEYNLVCKAAESLRNETGCDKGSCIHLEKHIPLGMGLGGGSSDAAAALIALNTFWDLGLNLGQLNRLGASLGSDVPFFLQGGTALGQGRGEVIVSLPALPQQWIVLVCPSPERISPGPPPTNKTRRLYSMLGREMFTDGSRTDRMVSGLRKGQLGQQLLFNAFEQVAPQAFWNVGDARKALLDVGAGSVHMTGTGPGLFAFVDTKEEGEGILKALKKKGLEAYVVCTVQPGVPSITDQERVAI